MMPLLLCMNIVPCIIDSINKTTIGADDVHELWDVLNEHREKTGRTHVRGRLNPGDYHLVVNVWILNGDGRFLISKRTPHRHFPNMWETTGGSAITGDDSITTAIKEVNEELGITLDKNNGILFKQYKVVWENKSGDFIDVWLFKQNVSLSDVTLLPDETCDAMLASKEEIRAMMAEGRFIGKDFYPYIDDLFNAC